MAARFAGRVEKYADSMTDQLVQQVRDALKVDVRMVANAERLRTSYWQRVRSFMERFDYILTPTVGAPPFRLDEPLPQMIGGRPVARYYDVFLATYAFSVIGLPALSTPCGVTHGGLPVGLQIVGRRLCEDSVLQAAAAFAEVRPEIFHGPGAFVSRSDALGKGAGHASDALRIIRKCGRARRQWRSRRPLVARSSNQS